MVALSRGVHGWSKIAWGFLGTDHPLLAHLIPMRRCNLACKYCNEYDDFSKPVPLDLMFKRVDKLGELGTSVVTISGGEPLLHPELDEIIGRIRALAKNAPPRKDRLDVNATILEVIALARSEVHGNGVALHTRLAERLAPVRGDRVQLQQVILNLMINAIEAMSAAGAAPRELSITSTNP